MHNRFNAPPRAVGAPILHHHHSAHKTIAGPFSPHRGVGPQQPTPGMPFSPPAAESSRPYRATGDGHHLLHQHNPKQVRGEHVHLRQNPPPPTPLPHQSPQPQPPIHPTASPIGTVPEEPPSPPAPASATPPAAHRAEILQDHYPPDCIYDINTFVRLKQCQKPVPTAIMEHAAALWKDMPENLASLPVNNMLRDNLFKEDTMSSKVLSDRKLHNEVMGILGKVTEINLGLMQTELTNLPIRQSTEEEIRAVVDVFFKKCTRPEDSRYMPLYVKLISYLISSIGESEPAGRMIRKEVMCQCRDTFVNAADISKALEERLCEMSPEEANLERMHFAGKQKANIYFLGLMFINRLTSEHVVRGVLDNLLYGEGRRRRVVPDYSVVHFMELLRTCGPYMDKSFHEEIMPRYVLVMEEFSRSYPQKRIQFLLLNFLEALANHWVPVHGHDHRTASAIVSGGATPAPPSVIIPDPKSRIPDREEFWKVMDDFFATSEIDDITAMMGTIPADVVVAYCSRWLGRYITTYRYTQERSRLGELFELLVAQRSITAQAARDALKSHLRQAIAEDLFTDQPKYFSHWAAVIKNGRSIFPPSLHTELLDLLVANNVSTDVIVKMVKDVQKAMEDGSNTGRPEFRPTERFRVLQSLLRYRPPLLCAVGCDEEDMLLDTAALDMDVEVQFFRVLCESYEDFSTKALTRCSEALRKPFLTAYPLISAYFTFVRFDVDNLCNTFREVLKRILSVRPPASLLEEVYVQWCALECPVAQYYAFVKKVLSLVPGKANDAIEQLCERLRSEYGADGLVAGLDKALK